MEKMPSEVQEFSVEDFFPAPPEVEAIVRYLMMAYFPHLSFLRIILLMRKTVIERGEGQITVAATGVSQDPEKDGFDCVFWFAADVWPLLNPMEKEAMVFHELKHCDHDNHGHGMMRPHDAAVFTQEVNIYGAWWDRPSEAIKESRGRTQDAK